MVRLAAKERHAYDFDVLPQLRLSVVMFQERVGSDAVWIAQCLEHNVLGHGATIADAQTDFERTVLAEILLALERGKEPLAEILPAPARFHEMWEQNRRGELSMRVFLTLPVDAAQAIPPDRIPRGEAVFRVAA